LSVLRGKQYGLEPFFDPPIAVFGSTNCSEPYDDTPNKNNQIKTNPISAAKAIEKIQFYFIIV